MIRHQELSRQMCAAPSSDCSAGFKFCVIFSLPVFQIPKVFEGFPFKSFFISKMFMLSFFSVLKIADFLK